MSALPSSSESSTESRRFPLKRFDISSAQGFAQALSARGVIGDNPELGQRVAEVVEGIREGGDRALAEFVARFDSEQVGVERFRVSEQEWDLLAAACPVPVREALELAAKRIRAFHQPQLPQGFRQSSEGAVVEMRVWPLDSVLCYTPGGLASYPSTVLMTAIPAKVAGVSRVVVTSPAKGDGDVSPAIAAAAKIAGATELWRIGGSQAVAAFALGTESIERVDKVVGPGNAYVTEAKRLLAAQVGIDLLAGPTEVMVLAEEGIAHPRWIAADLIAQAEHDPDARAVLVTPSESLAAAVEEAIAQEAPEGIAKTALREHGCIIVCPLPRAFEFAKAYAPEHLQLLLSDPEPALEFISTAGGVFVGPHTPVPVGDYLAGPNHTLPTSGTGRFSSGLGTADFVRTQTVVQYSAERLKQDREALVNLSQAEGLVRHGRTAVVREEF